MNGRYALILAWVLAPCAASQTTVESDPADVASGASSSGDASGSKHASTSKNAGTCPASGERCDDYGATCDAGTTHCHCTSPCSGVELPPEESYSRWACIERDRACPEAVPEDGQACRPNDLRCGYGTCGGASAICENKHWSVHVHAPPA